MDSWRMSNTDNDILKFKMATNVNSKNVNVKFHFFAMTTAA